MTVKRIHRPRIMPVLLLQKDGLLYKTQQFKKPKYVGDPRNAVRIFNEKCADELVLLDITATAEGRKPNFTLIEEIVSEAFMPIAYGGNIQSFEDARTIFSLGVEKVIINSAFYKNPELVTQITKEYGAQSVVVSIDAKKDWLGRMVCYSSGLKNKHKRSPQEMAKAAEQAGAGEILINAIDRDGMFAGYDEALCQLVAEAVSLPVIACGGAASVQDCVAIIKNTDISAAAAGSIFVFQGPHRAVLIKFPKESELDAYFS